MSALDAGMRRALEASVRQRHTPLLRAIAMRTHRLVAFATASLVLLSGCVTTRTTTTTWNDPAAGGQWSRPGHVESIRETVQRDEGNPAGGAVAGALIGGLLGSALGGHTYYDRRGYGHTHGSGAGAVVGAVGGAMVGAAASQGSSERRWYELFVRFDDGGLEPYVYEGYAPFQVGQPVTAGPGGLAAM
jgi:outer membrane lipoprotein SlyB